MENTLSTTISHYISTIIFEDLLTIITKIKATANQRYSPNHSFYFSPQEIIDMNNLLQIMLLTAQHQKISEKLRETLLKETLDFIDILYDKHNLYHEITHQLSNKVKQLNCLPKEAKACAYIDGKLLRLERTYRPKKNDIEWPLQPPLYSVLPEAEYRARQDDVKAYHYALEDGLLHQDEYEILKTQKEILIAEAEFVFRISYEKLTKRLLDALKNNNLDKIVLNKLIEDIDQVRQLLAGANLYHWIYQWFSELYLEIENFDTKIATYFLSNIVDSYHGKKKQTFELKEFNFKNSLSYRYKKTLQTYRETLRETLSYNSREALLNFNQQIQRFIKQRLTEASEILGYVKPDFCLLALGSLSREAMCAYSDIEVFLLVDKAYDATMLKQLFALFEFFITCIHEPNGFHIDSHTQHIATDPVPIDKVETYFRTLLASDGNAEQKHSDEMMCSLLHAQYLFGDDQLFHAYQSCLATLLTQRDETTQLRHEAWAYRQMHRHYEDVKKQPQNKIYDLKTHLVKPLTFCLLDLGLYYQLSTYIFEQTIQGLATVLNHMTPDLSIQLQQAFYTLQTYRCLRHFEKKQQEETFAISNDNAIFFNQYYAELIQPYYASLPLLIAGNEAEFKNYWGYLHQIGKGLPTQLKTTLRETQLGIFPCLPTNQTKWQASFCTQLQKLIEKPSSPNHRFQQLQLIWRYMPLNFVIVLEDFLFPVEDLFRKLIALQAWGQEPLKILFDYVDAQLTAEHMPDPAVIALLEQGVIKPLMNQLQQHLYEVPNLIIILKSFLQVRREWFESLDETAREQLINHPLLQILIDYPCPDGWSLQYYLEQQQWLQQVSCLGQIDISHCQIQSIPLQPGVKALYLPKTLVKACFSENGEFKGDSEYSSERSQVKKILWQGIVYFLKVKEGNQEGLIIREWAVEQLHRLLGGICQVAAGYPLKLVYINKESEKVYYAWLSQAIEGPSLGDIMRQKVADIQDWHSFSFNNENYTQLFLLAYLTYPEDGQPENFKFKDNRLIAIDNGHCFVSPTREEKNETVLNVKTMLYFLPQVQQILNEKILTCIKLLEVKAVFKYWKDKLEEFNEFFQSYTNLPMLPNPLGTIDNQVQECVRQRLEALQIYLKETSECSGMSILRKLDPAVALYYQSNSRKINGPQDFYNIDPKAYVKHPKTGKFYSSITLTQLKSRQITSARLQASLNLNAEYFIAIDFKQLITCDGQIDHEWQRFNLDLLKAAIKNPSLAKQFVELNLSGCHVIGEIELIKLLQQLPNLKQLDLTNCLQLNLSTIISIFSQQFNRRLGFFKLEFDVICPRLESVFISINNQVRQLSIEYDLQMRKLLSGNLQQYIGQIKNIIKILQPLLKNKNKAMHKEIFQLIIKCYNLLPAEEKLFLNSYLIKFLDHGEFHIRAAAIKVLSKIPETRKLITLNIYNELISELLSQLFKKSDHIERSESIEILIKLSKIIPIKLLKNMKDFLNNEINNNLLLFIKFPTDGLRGLIHILLENEQKEILLNLKEMFDVTDKIEVKVNIIRILEVFISINEDINKIIFLLLGIGLSSDNITLCKMTVQVLKQFVGYIKQIALEQQHSLLLLLQDRLKSQDEYLVKEIIELLGQLSALLITLPIEQQTQITTLLIDMPNYRHLSSIRESIALSLAQLPLVIKIQPSKVQLNIVSYLRQVHADLVRDHHYNNAAGHALVNLANSLPIEIIRDALFSSLQAIKDKELEWEVKTEIALVVGRIVNNLPLELRNEILILLQFEIKQSDWDIKVMTIQVISQFINSLLYNHQKEILEFFYEQLNNDNLMRNDIFWIQLSILKALGQIPNSITFFPTNKQNEFISILLKKINYYPSDQFCYFSLQALEQALIGNSFKTLSHDNKVTIIKSLCLKLKESNFEMQKITLYTLVRFSKDIKFLSLEQQIELTASLEKVVKNQIVSVFNSERLLLIKSIIQLIQALPSSQQFRIQSYLLQNIHSEKYYHMIQEIKIMNNLYSTSNALSQIYDWLREKNLTLSDSSLTWRFDIIKQIYRHLDEKTLQQTIPLVCKDWYHYQQAFFRHRTKQRIINESLTLSNGSGITAKTNIDNTSNLTKK